MSWAVGSIIVGRMGWLSQKCNMPLQEDDYISKAAHFEEEMRLAHVACTRCVCCRCTAALQP